MGFGYDNNLMPGCRHPTRELLDRLCPDNPLLISHASGHMGVANSAALAALGITDQTPDPDGGKIGREEGTRQPNGYLEETAFTMLGSRLPQPDFAQLSKQIQMAEKTYFRYGITTIQDGLTRESEWNLLKNMDQAGALTADVVAYINMVDSQKVLEENQKYLHADGHLRIGGYKIFLDGSPQGRTAWMSKPYLGEPADYTGYPIFSDQQVKEYIRTALDQQAQLLAHCNGDAAAEQFLRCCEEVQRETGKSIASIHPVMIHAQLLRRDQVPRLVPLGMVPSFFVAHVYHWGDVHIQNFGMERAAFISPVHSAIQAGLSPTFHQDTPVIGPDMMETLWCAVNRITRDGVVLGAQERISPWEGLKAITINAAGDGIKATNDEDTAKGTIQIDGGTFDITAGADGIQAENTLTVGGGTFSLVTGGGSANSSDKARTPGSTWGSWQPTPQTASDDANDMAQSAKALKAGNAIVINAGTYHIDSSDDSIHSNGTIDIKDGTFTLSSGDDGIHADTSLTIDGGIFDITKSYEGLESMSITLNGGKGSIVSNDDGINAAGGDGSSQNGRPGQNPMESASVDDGSIVLNINGGEWYINAGGDGLDSNASINQTGGTVTIDGPTDGGNGALDYDGTYNLTGGTLIAAGSSGMLQTPSSDSAQNSISLTFNTSQAAGTTISLKDANGEEIADYTPSKTFQNIIISTPDIRTGVTYTLTKGGADLTTVTPSSSVTSIGEDGSTHSGGIGGGPGSMGGPGGNRPGSSTPQDMQGGPGQ